MSSPPAVLFLLLLLFPLQSYSRLIGGDGERRVGGRTVIVNVESNKEIQDLGKFCVYQYNLKMRSSKSYPLLNFTKVVRAEKQVVSGIKYYLRISTKDVRSGGKSRMYDAVIVVKPWAKVRDLVSFAPAAGSW